MTKTISKSGIGRCILFAAALGCVPSGFGQSGLMRNADVHNDKIVFTYEGDLWLVGIEGGDARRLTNDAGIEEFAKFSPDGSLIAFTGNYDGGSDVYVMAADGGAPKRLTFHPAGDDVLGWSPDGKYVRFRSRREFSRRAERNYVVSIEGGMPQKLPVDRAGLSDVSPDGKQIAYNRITRETRTWKRHQGGTAQDIWLGSLERGDFRRITDWVGTDNYPMWHEDSIYFTSDRRHGTLNLFRYDLKNETTTPLTDYDDYDVKLPSIGPRHIVFQYGQFLHLLDLAGGQVRPVAIRVPSDQVDMRTKWVAVAPKEGAFSLSPTGKRLLLDARGEILNIPVEHGEAVNLTDTTATREKNGAWSPDGRWIAFISDKSGEEEFYLVDQLGEQPWRQLTTGGKGFRRQPVWSPDSKWLSFSDKFLQLNLVNAESGEMTRVDRGEYDDGWYRWGIQDYTWSPDSRWIAYTKLEQSGNEAVFLFSMAERAVHRVTDDVHPDWSPSFDPKGRYLYFLSSRAFHPIMGFVEQNYVFLDMVTPFLVVLKDGEPSPFAPEDSEEKPDELAKGDKDENADGPVKKDEADKENSIAAAATQVDIPGIGRRILAIPGVGGGNYFRLTATEDGFLYLKRNEHQFEKYQTVTDETGGKLDLYHYKLDEKEPKLLLSGIANYHVSADGKKLVYRAGDQYGVVDVGKEAKTGDGAVKLDSVYVKVDRNDEFLQMFNEAWRVQRDWFYDANMHGVDWKAMGEKYRALVPFCGDRSDLNYLIGEMIGELDAGHTYVRGGDLPEEGKKVEVGLLGVEFDAGPSGNYHRIAHIIPGTPGNESERSPLDEPGCPIREGDYLIAIDGREVTISENVYAFLENKKDVVVTLTYNSRPTAEGAKKHRIRTLANEDDIRYREWVDRNRAFVDQATAGRVGYVHIPDMMDDGLREFARHYFSHHYKNGFIIDVRYNGGGFTSQMIIDRLERRMWALTQPREGKMLNDPERCFYGHMAVLINEDTGSSGEWFAEGVKVRGLAPLIGMRTWGGAVGIELHQPLVDGGFTTPPQFGPYGLNGKWLIEGHGVDPDFEVQNMPGDVLRGKDAQLEAAISNILERLAKEPMEIPPPPPYPDKRKKRDS